MQFWSWNTHEWGPMDLDKKRESNQHGRTEIKSLLFLTHIKKNFTRTFQDLVLCWSGAKNQDFVKLSVYMHISFKVPSLTFGGQRNMGLRHLLFYILTYMSGTVSDTRGPQISRHSSCPHITHRCSRWMVTWTGISDRVECSTEKLRILRGVNRRQIQPSLTVVRKARFWGKWMLGSQ